MHSRCEIKICGLKTGKKRKKKKTQTQKLVLSFWGVCRGTQMSFMCKMCDRKKQHRLNLDLSLCDGMNVCGNVKDSSTLCAGGSEKRRHKKETKKKGRNGVVRSGAYACVYVCVCLPSSFSVVGRKKKMNKANGFFMETEKIIKKISCWVSRLVSHPLCYYFFFVVVFMAVLLLMLDIGNFFSFHPSVRWVE